MKHTGPGPHSLLEKTDSNSGPKPGQWGTPTPTPHPWCLAYDKSAFINNILIGKQA